MPRGQLCLVIVVVTLAVAAVPARGQSGETAQAWLDSLYDEVAEDLKAGKPLVVQVHVPLCDNDIIWCGNQRLGDGDDPDRNLYWATSGGFRGWFGRKSLGWRLVHRQRDPHKDVLDLKVWRKRVRPSAALRKRGVSKPFAVYVVAHAWRGEAIGMAMKAYARDLFGSKARAIDIEGITVQAGGAARVVGFVGHNGWMDVREFRWPAQSKGPLRKGTIAIACITEDYLADAVPDETRVPLLFTRSLMFAGAHSFEGAVSAFAEGQSLSAIHSRAAKNHGIGQGKAYKRVRSAFVNPASRHWKSR